MNNKIVKDDDTDYLLKPVAMCECPYWMGRIIQEKLPKNCKSCIAYKRSKRIDIDKLYPKNMRGKSK